MMSLYSYPEQATTASPPPRHCRQRPRARARMMALPCILPCHSPPSHDTHRSWRVHALHLPLSSSLCVRRAGRRGGKPGTGRPPTTAASRRRVVARRRAARRPTRRCSASASSRRVSCRARSSMPRAPEQRPRPCCIPPPHCCLHSPQRQPCGALPLVRTRVHMAAWRACQAEILLGRRAQVMEVGGGRAERPWEEEARAPA